METRKIIENNFVSLYFEISGAAIDMNLLSARERLEQNIHQKNCKLTIEMVFFMLDRLVQNIQQKNGKLTIEMVFFLLGFCTMLVCTCKPVFH